MSDITKFLGYSGTYQDSHGRKRFQGKAKEMRESQTLVWHVLFAIYFFDIESFKIFNAQ